MNRPIPTTGEVALAHLGVIRASGADATAFLHGQLTNDIAGMAASEARLAGFCSAKGRLQASFLAWRDAAGDILLACSASLLPATLKRLSMFVLRARCKLSDATAEVPLRGRIGACAEASVGSMQLHEKRELGGATLIRLADAAGSMRCLAAGPASDAGASPSDCANAPPSASITLDLWRWLEVQSGVPIIEAATVDQFVPQMLNFELLGGIDFQKGCYPGQEVVARSHYRGTIKRRMFLFDCDAAPSPANEVFHSADPSQPAGMVVNAAPGPQGWSALVEVKLAALDDGTLHVGSVDGPVLHRCAMPYSVS